MIYEHTVTTIVQVKEPQTSEPPQR